MSNAEKYNTFRVAAASSDGYEIDTHFGRAENFYVYQFFDGEWIFVEKRTVNPVCLGGRHSVEEMQRNVEQFSDCQYVAASKIGQGATAALQSKGITAMQLPGDINQALQKIFSYNEIQNLFKN